MNGKSLIGTLVNKGASFLSVVLLLSIVAAPALAAAVVAANSVNSAAIIDGQVRTRDIARRAVTARKIAPGAVRSAQIKDGSVANADIAAGAGISDSKIGYATKTGRIQVPPSAFMPPNEAIGYRKWSSLENRSGIGSYFFAPVYLPNGAAITNLGYQAYDDDPVGSTSAQLYRVVNGLSTEMAATGVSATTGGWQTLSDNTILSPVVDTLTYAYYVNVFLPGIPDTIKAGNVIIDFTYNSPGH